MGKAFFYANQYITLWSPCGKAGGFSLNLKYVRLGKRMTLQGMTCHIVCIVHRHEVG